MPTQHEDTIVSALADGETVDGLFVRSTSTYNHTTDFYSVVATVVFEGDRREYDCWTTPKYLAAPGDEARAIVWARRTAALRAVLTVRAIRKASK